MVVFYYYYLYSVFPTCISLSHILPRKQFYNVEYGSHFWICGLLKQAFIFAACILMYIMETCNQFQNNSFFHFTLGFKDNIHVALPYLDCYFNCCLVFHGACPSKLMYTGLMIYTNLTLENLL